MKQKGGFRLFLSSIIPGGGQMYQGYMKRGLSLMLAFFCLIGVAALINLGELAMFLPVIWLYAFFDSYNIRGRSDEEREREPDEYMFGFSMEDNKKFASIYQKRHKIIGWVLIFIGVYAGFSMMTDYYGGWFSGLIYDFVHYELPRVVVTILIIVLGIWFIRGPRKKRSEPADFTAYEPPAEKKEERDHDDRNTNDAGAAADAAEPGEKR